jgi:hypothetical protein
MLLGVDRETFLRSKVSDLAGYWIEITCPTACVGGGVSRRTGIPCKLLAERGYGNLRVSQLLPKLRCEKCGSKPSLVQALDNPAGPSPQYPDTWVETLLP